MATCFTDTVCVIPLPKNHKTFLCEVTSNLKLKLLRILLLDTLLGTCPITHFKCVFSRFVEKLVTELHFGNGITVTEFCGSSCRIRILYGP